MLRLGTEYGGWIIPENNILNENSIIYSGGVGEDISFDIKLQSKYGCNIILIDPTQKALNHYKECIQYFKDKDFRFTGNIQNDYYKEIEKETPDFNKIKYINQGLWNKKDTLKFYKQNNNDYVSQSLIQNMFGDNYDIVDVDSIKSIMNKNNHNKVDLLKIDIEGAENIVLEQMLDDKIYPKYLCIEFDLIIKNKDPQQTTQKIIDRLLQTGYKIIVNDRLNITFEYTK
jgi:FkbM family methyltransferase